jgi:hypothetical protein
MPRCSPRPRSWAVPHGAACPWRPRVCEACILRSVLAHGRSWRCCAAPSRARSEVSRAARDWARSRRGLPPAQRLILLVLAERANDRGDRCLPSLRQLELVTELSRRGITKALYGGEGRLIERYRGGPRRSTSYRLLLAVPIEDERPSEDVGLSSLPVGREQRASRKGTGCPLTVIRNRHRTGHAPLLCGNAAPHAVNAGGDSRPKSCRVQPGWRPGECGFDWAAKQGVSRT